MLTKKFLKFHSTEDTLLQPKRTYSRAASCPQIQGLQVLHGTVTQAQAVFQESVAGEVQPAKSSDITIFGKSKDAADWEAAAYFRMKVTLRTSNAAFGTQKAFQHSGSC